MSSKKVQFEAELIEGHKGVLAVIVPFNPETLWKQKPVQLEGSREGWLVKGTVNKKRFSGYVGSRWGRFFILIDEELRASLDVSVGEMLSIAVAPTAEARVLVKARAQSKVTTAPSTRRRKTRSQSLKGKVR